MTLLAVEIPTAMSGQRNLFRPIKAWLSGRGAPRPPMVSVKLPKSELVVFHLL